MHIKGDTGYTENQPLFLVSNDATYDLSPFFSFVHSPLHILCKRIQPKNAI